MADRLELVAAAQAGDTQAFAGLVDMHYAMVHGLAYSRVHDWGVAEDLTQDVFMTAWTNLHQLKHAEAFLVWLRKIARNLSLNWIRKQEYRRCLAELDGRRKAIQIQSVEDPVAGAARRECLEHIGEGLRSLSPKLREALVLHYLEGHTAAISAEMLGISTDALKKRLKLGREKLHSHYRRREALELEPLLPHHPKKQVEHIVAGLALGPAWPELATSISKASPLMPVQDLIRGASLPTLNVSGLKTAGITLPLFYTAFGASVMAALAVGAGAVLVISPGGPEQAGEPIALIAAPPPDSPSLSPVPPDPAWDGVGSTRYFPVENLFGDNVPSGSGLEPGDRIVKVNGLPLSASVREDPRSALTVPPGTLVRATVLRRSEDGGAQEVEVSFNMPYTPKRY